MLSVNDGELVDPRQLASVGITHQCVPFPDEAPPQPGDLEVCIAGLPIALQFALSAMLYADPEAPEPQPDPDLRLLVNGRNALFLDGLDTQLSETDVVTVHFAGARSFPGG